MLGQRVAVVVEDGIDEVALQVGAQYREDVIQSVLAVIVRLRAPGSRRVRAPGAGG